MGGIASVFASGAQDKSLEESVREAQIRTDYGTKIPAGDFMHPSGQEFDFSEYVLAGSFLATNTHPKDELGGAEREYNIFVNPETGENFATLASNDNVRYGKQTFWNMDGDVTDSTNPRKFAFDYATEGEFIKNGGLIFKDNEFTSQWDNTLADFYREQGKKSVNTLEKEVSDNRLVLSAGPIYSNSKEFGDLAGGEFDFGFYGKNLGFSFNAGFLSGLENGELLSEERIEDPAYNIVMNKNETLKKVINTRIGGDFKIGGPINEDISLYASGGGGVSILNYTTNQFDSVSHNGMIMDQSNTENSGTDFRGYARIGAELISKNIGIGLYASLDTKLDPSVAFQVKYSLPNFQKSRAATQQQRALAEVNGEKN